MPCRSLTHCVPSSCSGKGLGKNEDGMTEALKAKRKEDNTGVRAPLARLREWLLHSVPPHVCVACWQSFACHFH